MNETETGTAVSAGETGKPLEHAGARAETYGAACPLCGGSLRVHEGEKSVHCRYCASALYITIPRGVKSFLMLPKVTSGKGRLAALRYLSEKTGGRVKGRHASIVETKLIHIPFWRMHGRLIGWMCGQKTGRKEVEYTVPAEYGERVCTRMDETSEPFSKLSFKRVDWSMPACMTPHLGLQGISLKTRFLDWEIFDQKHRSKHNVALPMLSAERARKDAFSYLRRLAAPMGTTIGASRFHLFDNRFSLYYYPIYFLRYRHGKRIYSITIDGCDGHIIRGETPETIKVDPRGLFFIPAVMALVAGTYFPLLLIAAGVLYIIDSLKTVGFLPLHRWLAARLDGWFGAGGRNA